jgi:peptidoglycan/LPS O-acetylase OafA/YrhL
LSEFIFEFYARRIKRLAPALIVFVLLSSVVTIIVNPIPRDSLTTGIAALFGLSNLYLLRLSTDYFAGSTELNGFTHTWSLGVEEQFYLIYPLCVWLYGNGARVLPKLVFGVSVVSLAGFAILYHVNQPAAYFLMPTRFWELGGGASVYFWRQSLARPLPNGLTTLVGAAILLVLFAPLSAAVPATVAIVGLTGALIAALRPGTLAYAALSRPAAVYVGLISYSLYLWHWGVLALSRWTVGVHLWTAPFQIGLMFLLAAASYHFIERPLRRARWSSRRPLSVAYGVFAYVAASGAIAATALKFSTPPAYLQHTWWTDRDTGKYIEKCHVEYAFRSDYVDECLAGARGDRKHAYLIGDSHARNYLPAVRDAFARYDVRYLTMGYGCAFLPPELAARASGVHCQDYVEAVSRFLRERARSGDVVLIGQMLIDEDERQTPLYLDFIKRFAGLVTGQGASVVLLDGVVPPDQPPESCVGRFGDVTRGCAVARAVVASAYEKFDRLAREAEREIPNFYYAPLRTGLCNGELCGQRTAAGAPIWHNRGHITEQAARELAPMLRADLAKQGFFKQTPPRAAGVDAARR